MRVVAFRIGRLKGKPFWVLLLFTLFIFFLYRSVHNYHVRLLSVQLSASEFAGQVAEQGAEELREIEDQFATARTLKGTQKIKGIYKLTMFKRDGQQVYLFDQPGVLCEPQTGIRLALADGGRCLRPLVERLTDKNPYGEFLTWEEARKVFRKFDKARVRDLETGMSFEVQRRAGSNHADVQPLTVEDSSVMKTIYGGRWSWRRRAIVVELKGHRIAASMNGMPHGAGAIANNDFNGHFCIHFRDSKTHSNLENLSHQLMVWKAANRVEEMLRSQSPQYTTGVFLEALAQSDARLATTLVKAGGELDNEKVYSLLRTISWIAVSEMKLKGSVKDLAEVNVVAAYGLKNGAQVKDRKVTFKLVRDGRDELWRIQADALRPLFEKLVHDPTNPPRESVYQDWNVELQM